MKKINNQINSQGFTLVELLVAIAIMGIISVVAVRSLYDIVSVRAKQQSIEISSDSFRTLTRLITKSVIESNNVDVPNNHELNITGNNSCETLRYDPSTASVLYAKVSMAPCTPPNSGFTTLTDPDLVINNFSLTPTGTDIKVVSVEIDGFYKNSLGDHPIKYSTTITPRL